MMAVYMLSVCGVNIHTCSHTGRTYVGLLIGGTSCEEVHGADSECCCCAHHHHHHSDTDASSCCHNSALRLAFAGGSDHGMQTLEKAPAPVLAHINTPYILYSSEAEHSPSLLFSDISHLPDVLHAICVLRV